MEIAKPTVANVTITSANTEYSYTLPAGTRYFWLRFRNPETFGKLAVVSGESGTTYFKIDQQEILKEPVKAGGSTLYFQGDNASDVVEVISFK